MTDMSTPSERAVSFRVRHEFEATARTVWDELIDWEGHGAWIPMTHTDVHDADPTAVGARFTAYTGVGRLALEDRMEVAECAWDDAAGSGRCVVDKHGPILFGRAGFDVIPTATGSVVDWFEDVDVKRLPKFLAPVATKFGSIGFRQGMKKLAKLLDQRAG